MKKLNGKSDREKSLLSNAMLQAAPGIACRCPLPGKYLPVRARQSLAGRIAASSRQSRSLSVALQMSARASTAVACRAYRTKKPTESRSAPLLSAGFEFSVQVLRIALSIY